VKVNSPVVMLNVAPSGSGIGAAEGQRAAHWEMLGIAEALRRISASLFRSEIRVPEIHVVSR
jgi:hypothetical protein